MTKMKVWVTLLCKEPEQWRFWLRTRNGQLKEAEDDNYNLMTNYRNEAYSQSLCILSSCLLYACVYMYTLAIIFSLLPIFYLHTNNWRLTLQFHFWATQMSSGTKGEINTVIDIIKVFSFWERVFTCKKNNGSFVRKNIDFCCYEEV